MHNFNDNSTGGNYWTGLCGVALRHQNNIPDELLDYKSKYKFRPVTTMISMLIIYNISSNVISVTPLLNWRRDLYINSYLVIISLLFTLMAFCDWVKSLSVPKKLVCLALIGYAQQADLWLVHSRPLGATQRLSRVLMSLWSQGAGDAVILYSSALILVEYKNHHWYSGN